MMRRLLRSLITGFIAALACGCVGFAATMSLFYWMTDEQARYWGLVPVLWWFLFTLAGGLIGLVAGAFLGVRQAIRALAIKASLFGLKGILFGLAAGALIPHERLFSTGQNCHRGAVAGTFLGILWGAIVGLIAAAPIFDG